MRICHVVYSHYPSDPRVRKETEALAGAGYEVHVIAARETGELREESLGTIRVHRIPLRIIRGSKVRYLYQYVTFFLASFALLAKLQLHYRFRVVHVHSLPDFQVFVAWFSRLCGAAVVLDLHEAMPEIIAARFHLPQRSLLLRIAELLEVLSCSFADRVIVVAEQRALLVASRSTHKCKIAVVMNTVDLDPSTIPPPGELRSRLGLNGRRVLVHAGGINSERDLETLFRAAEILAHRQPVTVLVFGKGDAGYVQHLHAVAEKEASHVDVRFSGWIAPSSVLEHLQLSDVGLGTYERNPMTELAAPHKVFEAVAVDRPLVLADVAGLRLVWSGAALFYQPGDADDLARQIWRLIMDPSLAFDLRSVAKRIAAQMSWKESRQILLQAYHQLVYPRAVASSEEGL